MNQIKEKEENQIKKYEAELAKKHIDALEEGFEKKKKRDRSIRIVSAFFLFPVFTFVFIFLMLIMGFILGAYAPCYSSYPFPMWYPPVYLVLNFTIPIILSIWICRKIIRKKDDK